MIAKPVSPAFAARALFLLTLLSGAAPAWAASRVVLLRSSSDDALSRQGTTLLTAELQAAGFEVAEVERDPARDLRQDIDATSARLQPVATFAIRPVPGGTTVELWLADRVTGKLVIRRVDVTSGPGAAADLALKAVELLRGSLLEVTVQGRPGSVPPPPAPGEVTRFVAEADRLDFFGQGVGVAAGGAALVEGELASSFAPLLRLSWGGSTGLMLRLTAAGLGSSPELRAPEGNATVHQMLVLAEGLRVFRPRARLQPLVGVDAGVYHVSSEGMGVSTLFPNGADTTTAAIFGAQGGVAARLGNRLAVVVDATVLMAQRTTVWIAAREAAHAGGLALMASASLCGAF
ncbi:MAG: hypothetical protein ABUS79_23315 [Pseudomonadota bacterium]